MLGVSRFAHGKELRTHNFPNFSNLLMYDVILQLVGGSIELGDFWGLTSLPTWWRHQMETFSALLAICAGNSPVSGEFPHKSQWRGALMFSLMCVWINGCVNNREAGDLRRHRAHYDVTVLHWGLNKVADNMFILWNYLILSQIALRFLMRR